LLRQSKGERAGTSWSSRRARGNRIEVAALNGCLRGQIDRAIPFRHDHTFGPIPESHRVTCPHPQTSPPGASGVARALNRVIPRFVIASRQPPGVAMVIAGGPETRLADPHARENPGIPLPRDASPRMSGTRASSPHPSALFLSFSLPSRLSRPSGTWIYTQFNRSSPLVNSRLFFSPPPSTPVFHGRARCKNPIKASNTFDDLFPDILPRRSLMHDGNARLGIRHRARGEGERGSTGNGPTPASAGFLAPCARIISHLRHGDLAARKT